MNKALAWFKSLSFAWQITIIVVIIIIIYIVYKRYGYLITNKFKDLAGGRNLEPYTIQGANGETITITNENNIPASKKQELEKLARDIKSDISGINFGNIHKWRLYDAANAYQDLELFYLSKYYKTLPGKVSLWQDMDDEGEVSIAIGTTAFSDNNSWGLLKDKLTKIGER